MQPNIVFATGYFHSPLGAIKIIAGDEMLISLELSGEPIDRPTLETPLLKRCCNQLAAYFSGHLALFSLPLAITGTAFQKRILTELAKIPYGTTISYRQLAAAAGRPGAFRAAGNAGGRNPFPILIPCHRVIRSDGKPGGYSCGTWRKEWLLEHERRRSIAL